MRARALAAVPLLVVATVVYAGPSWSAADASDAVSAEVAFEAAVTRGDLAMEGTVASLLVEGAPGLVAVRAREVHVTMVRVSEQFLDHPVAEDIGIVTGTEYIDYEFDDATLAPVGVNDESVLYAFSEGSGSLRVSLLRGEWRPLQAAGSPYPFLAGERGQRWAFEHEMAVPVFGFAKDGDAPFRASMLQAEMSGDFSLILDNSDYVVESGSRSQLLETGRYEHDATSVGSRRTIYQGERTYAIVEVSDGEFVYQPGLSDYRALASEPAFHVNGSLVLSHTSGVIRHTAGGRGLSDDVMRLEGNLTLLPRARLESAELLREERYRTSSAISGDARDLSINGQAVQLSSRVPVQEATLAALLLGALALAWSAVQRAVGPIALPLFTRITGKQALENAQRARIFHLIRLHPLVHQSELQRQTTLGFGTVAYHLRVLRRERLISSYPTQRERLYYPTSAPLRPETARARAALMHPTRRRVAKAVLASGPGGATQISLALALGVSHGHTCRLLNDLSRAGLVEVRGAKSRRYSPSELLRTLGEL